MRKESRMATSYCCNAKKIKSAEFIDCEPGSIEKSGLENKLCRQERIEIGRLFQDSIWFLRTEVELKGITEFIKKLVADGACDFTRAVQRTSFLAACVSACQSRTVCLADTISIMAQRLHERLQECNGDEILKVEASAKVQKFTEWALKCISAHSRLQDVDNVGHISAIEVQLQLSGFKMFLDLAGNRLTGKDFSEAFDAACFPLTLFSSSFDPSWALGISATVIQGLLGMLVDGGADNVNQCFLEASRFGSTELVRILLQIAQRNNLDVDVDLALGFASHYCKIGTMECLVEEGNAIAFLGPLMRAAERGCIQVVEWFVQRGSRDMELCLALTAATSSCQVDIAAYILPHVPRHVLSTLSIEIIKAAGERSGGSLDGVAFLLQSDFLGDPASTYAVADIIAKSEDEGVASELRTFLHEHWSEAAYLEGVRLGQEHYMNLLRIIKWGGCLKDLPIPLIIAIAYLPLYRECSKAGGCLFSQRLRGQLVEATRRLGNTDDRVFDDLTNSRELLLVLEHHLPDFLVSTPID
ncbi:hypothetical protein AAHE18_11G173600 [Arachis hypogaea]